jgi:cell division protein ZipA
MDIKSLILIAGGVMIVAVILHGIYIAWRARRENLPMEIARDLIPEDFDEEARFRHELPNGGARVLPQFDGGLDSPNVNGGSSPPMLLNATGLNATGLNATGLNATGLNATGLNATGTVPRAGMTARSMSARAGVATRELPLEPSGRETTRRNGSHHPASPTQSRQDIDDELFGSSDALFTENRRLPTQAQQESRREARSESKSSGTATTGGYARTNGSHAASPVPSRVDPQPVEPQAVPAKAEAPALRPRVQNVTVPTNAQPVQRRAAKESALKDRLTAQASEPESSKEKVDEDAVISIFLLARPGRTFSGQALYKALRAHGIKYGEMNIFHRVDPVSRVNLYSVANAVNPGTFDYSNLDELQTPGVAFFMQLQGLDHPLRIFDDMRRVASGLASSLDGELKDENRSVIGLQTFDHYRERIAEYSRRRLSRPA